MKLYKRPDGRSANWYVRLIIPSALQSAFDADRFIASTKSSDKTLARARAAEIVAVWERKLYQQAMTLRDSGRFEEQEPRSAVVSQDLIELLCTSRIGSHMQTDDAERVVGLTEKQSLEIDDSVLARLADATAVAIRGKGATKEYARLHEDAEDWAHQLGYDFDDSDPLLPQYVVAFAKAQKQALDLIARRQKGDDARTPDDTLGKSLVELADAWREDNKTLLEERTLKSYPRRFEALDHYVKHIPAKMVTRTHVHNWLRYLLHDEKLAENTVNDGYFAAAKAIFALATSNGLIPVDPTIGVKKPKLNDEDALAREEERYPFNKSQLNQLFASPWYAGAGTPVGESAIHQGGGVTYWVPLIAHFQGFREAEVCELLTENIILEDGVLAFEVTDVGLLNKEGEKKRKKKVKNTATKRRVPVHATLLELGFAQFVDEMRRSNAKRLFPALDVFAGSGADNVGKQFNRYVKRQLKFSKGHVFHSFRHGWEDARRIAQAKASTMKMPWPPGMHLELSGRAKEKKAVTVLPEGAEDEGSARDYGQGYPVSVMKPYLDQIVYSGVQLPMPWSEFRKRFTQAKPPRGGRRVQRRAS